MLKPAPERPQTTQESITHRIIPYSYIKNRHGIWPFKFISAVHIPNKSGPLARHWMAVLTRITRPDLDGWHSPRNLNVFQSK